MSLIKLSAKILKSPFAIANCRHGLLQGKETLLGVHSANGSVHFFQMTGKNRMRHFTPAMFGKIPKDLPSGAPFLGAVQEFTNKDAKRKLSKFTHVFRFKDPESAIRFREALKEL